MTKQIFRRDVLTIYDGGSKSSPLIEKYEGRFSILPSQVSSGNEIFIHFKTDRSNTNTGFKLQYNPYSKLHFTTLLLAYVGPSAQPKIFLAGKNFIWTFIFL